MKWSLSTWVLVSFVAGIAAGLIAGDWCSPLHIIGDIYVGLLQMTVLPYIVASLVLNLGRLTPALCRRLAVAITTVLSGLWLLMALLLLILPLALPDWRAGSFFSSSMLDAPAQIDILELFIPTNPFEALARNVVPAAVLFSICVGAALIGVDHKQPLLDALQALLSALGRVNHVVAMLSPVGVFAIMAATAGTISFEDFSRLQAYLVTYFVGTLLMGLLILPALVSATTPVGYFALLRVAWAPMLTAFATGKTLVVLPMIAEGTTRLLRDAGEREPSQVSPETLVALGYPFPHLGKLIGLLFIPFAAWFAGAPMDWTDYPSILGAGLVSMFGSAVASIPFLLDLERLPADLFQMFLASGVICGRLGDLLGVVSLFALSILTTCLLERKIKLNVTKLVGQGLLAVSLVLVSVGVTRTVLTPLVNRLPSKDQLLLGMHSAVVAAPDKELPAVVPATAAESGMTRLQRIQQRGALRVGCLADNLPFSFRNEAGNLVGFDIDMAHLLATELDCELWLVPIAPEQLSTELERDTIDLAMCGIIMTTDRLQLATFSRPYMRVTMSLMVPDYRRREFGTLSSVRQLNGLRIATLPSRQFQSELARLFPQAEVTTIYSAREFFTNPALEADALLISVEAGSAWTLIYPGFTPVVPQPQPFTVPLAYPIAAHDAAFADFMSQWVELKTASPTFRRMYDYWILGQAAETRTPRWSVLRNVLGWRVDEAQNAN